MLGMELVFWALVAAVLWAYVGYPMFLTLAARDRRPARSPAPMEPSVSVIISAYNEERAIRQKLQNTLVLDYPREKLDIIVASDCSSDRTDAIVTDFQPLGVKLIVLPERAGKTAAQNLATKTARGEILVFTDATTKLRPDAIRNLVKGFADPRIGCVGAELDYVSKAGTAIGRGGGLYWRYEKRIKELESRVNSLTGVSGCLYAVRANLYTPIDPDLISDFTIALRIFAKGYVTRYAPGTVSEERTHEDIGREFQMRTRVIIRTIHALVRNAGMLNPFRYGFFALQLWSHKVLRYLVPELLLAAFFVSLALALAPHPRAWLYQLVVVSQLAVYVVIPALYGAFRRCGLNVPVLCVPLYFTQANAAAFWALIMYMRGRREVTWTTVR